MRDASRRPKGRLCCWMLVIAAAFAFLLPASGEPVPQSGPATTTVADTVYLADGTPAQGTLIITWPAFVTASGAAVAAGNTNVTLATNGVLSVALVPNAGATPAGVYYTVVYQIGPGEVKTEYWVVPTTSPANLAAVRTTPGAGQAQPAVSTQYVNSALATKANDNAVVHLAGTETISGAKTFSAAPNVPTPTSAGQVANKGYVDSSVANVGAGNYLPTAGGTMTGPITLPANPAAPLQAATKQYVDTGVAAKADLVSGLVPAGELGTGLATTGNCLQGNGSSATWGACGSGGGTGNISTTPTANQNIAQPAGTEFSSNNFGNIRYVTASWNWAQTPGDNLGTAGNHTIHLGPCPLGLDTSNNTSAPYRVYVSGTGTPEAVTVTGGSCPAGTASGTITVTTAYGHGPGYTVGSATAGIQEAINDSSAPHGVIQLLPASGSGNPNYIVYTPVFLHTTRAKLSGYGALVECYTRSACIVSGDEAGTSGSFNTIEGMEITPGLNIDGVQIASVAAASGVFTVTTAANHPFVTGDYVTLFYSTPAATQEARIQITVTAANQFQYTIGSSMTFANSSGYGWVALENAALEDLGEHVLFKDIKLSGWAGGFFSWGIVFDNDQSAKVDGLTNEGSGVVKCATANFCGAMVYARGDSGVAPVLEIDHLEANMQCGGNGVRYVPGNTLHIQNSVVEGFNQYGVYYGGGLQPLTFATTYEESSAGCYNYAYPGGTTAAAVGVLSNSDMVLLSDDPIGGAFPWFVAANPGSQENNYYVVIHSSTLGNMGMYYIGGCATTGAGSCTTYWPEPNLDGLGTVTYDVLATTGLSALPPIGSGSYAVATGISGNCGTTGICTFVDPQTGTSAYTVGGLTNSPKLNFWPAGITLGAGAHLTEDRCGQNAAVVTTTYLPAVFCNHAIVAGANSQHTPYFAVYEAGDPIGAANPSVGATLKLSGPSVGAASSGQKGMLNFINFGWLGQSDLITLADCNPFLTLATGGYRPSWSTCDTALGFDSAPGASQTTAGLFLRAPYSISQYINALPTGSNWLERLTATGKTFNVPVAVNGNLAVSGGTVTLPITGTGAQCLHVSATGAVSGTGADCGSGSVNAGVTSQVAMYSGSGTAVSGDSTLTDNGTTLSYGGSGGITAASGTFSGNVTVNGQLLVAGPWAVSSPIPGTAMGAASAGTSALGISNDGNFYISANGGTPQRVATSATSSYFSNLFQEDANDLGMYNSTNPQNLHVYSSYTNSSTWQRTSIGLDPGTGFAVLRSESTGTAPGLGFMVGSGVRWVIDPSSSSLKPWADMTYNIGSFSGTSGVGLRPATVYAAGNATSNSGFELGKYANTSYELCNDTTNGTVINGLAVLTAGGCAAEPSSPATAGVIGVVVANAGTSGTATLARTGSAYCSFDATPTVVGDFVVPSSVAHSGFYYLCHDAGATQPTGVQVLGRVLQASGGGTTVQMFFDMPGLPTGTGVFVDASSQPGATLDAKLNAANAVAITNNGGVVDARALGGAQTIASQVNVGQLLAPTVTAVTGTSPGAGTYKLVYTLTSPAATETSASAESTVTVTGSQAIQVNSPTYYGTATSYSVYMTAAGGNSWTEVKCAAATNVAIGTNTTITATCSGAAVSKGNNGFAVSLIPPKVGVWTVTIADTVANTSCGVKFFDQSSFEGQSGGEGRPWYLTSNSSTNVEALWCTDPNPKNGGAGYYNLRGISAHGISSDSIQTAVAIIRGTADTDRFDDIQATSYQSYPALYVYGNSALQVGAATRISGQFEGNSAACPVLQIGSTTQTTISGVDFHDISVVHPGNTTTCGSKVAANVGIVGGVRMLKFTGHLYMEGPASGPCGSPIQIGTSAGFASGSVDFDTVEHNAACTGTSAYLFSAPTTAIGHLSVHSTVNGQFTNLFSYAPNTALNISGVGVGTTYPEFVMDNNNPVTLLTQVTAPTPATSDSSTNVATTAFVKGQGYATLASPIFTGVPQAPTPATSDSSTKIATTAWVNAQGYGTGSGNVSGPASSVSGDIATFSGTNGKTIQDSGTALSALAPVASPTFTGTVTLPDGSTVSSGAWSLSSKFPTLNQNTTGTAAGLSAASTLPNGTTATTQSAKEGTTKIATDAYADGEVPSTSLQFLPFNDYNVINQSPFPTSGSSALIISFTVPYAVTTSKVAYRVGTTADNTSNTYEVGVYNSSGSLVLSFQAAGTTFAPTASTMYRQSWSQGSTTLSPGKYYLALSSSCTSSCATFTATGTNVAAYYYQSTASGIASGGTLGSSITAPGSGYESFGAQFLSVIFE